MNLPKSIKEILKDFDLEKRRRYISKEFQAYGLMLASELKDWKNKSLYIKLAKTFPRDLLEKARFFVKDQNKNQIKNPARLFMWKLGQLKKEKTATKSEPADRQLPRQPLKHSKNG